MALAQMIRVQVQLNEAQLQALKTRAYREHVSVSALVRRAAAAWIAVEAELAPAERRRRAIDAAGAFASGLQDVARRHDDYLAEAYHQSGQSHLNFESD